jgi:hypothetical protein
MVREGEGQMAMRSFRVIGLSRGLALLGVGLAVFLASTNASGTIPLGPAPTWESNDTDFGTGGALADVDGNGYLDLCVSNGNDMGMNANAVYMNFGGSLETTASWVSTDLGYFGHNAVGDVDNDGDVDMAVGYYGSFTPYVDNIYYNLGDSLETTPSWHQAISDSDNSFACAFGDVDGDGDLDIVFSGGEMYSNRIQRSKLYLNNGCVFDTLAAWMSTPSYTYGVAWGDVDNDGDLDLALATQDFKNQLYYNNGGVLESLPSWESDDIAGGNQAVFGDVNGDGWLDLAVANTYGASYVEVYFNQGETLETSPSWTSKDDKTYYSCVAFGDVDNDGDLDLAAGGWWEPVVVFENNGGMLDTLPTWSWITANPTDLVCETVLWGDVDGDGVIGSCDACDGDGSKKVFYLMHYPAHKMEDVTVDGSLLPITDYCYDLNAGWISFKNAPATGSANISICYDYSTDLDLIVTNWNSLTGNFVFDNTTTRIDERVSASTPRTGHAQVSAQPNPFTNSTKITMALLSGSGPARVSVYDAAGRIVAYLCTLGEKRDSAFNVQRFNVQWDGTDASGKMLPAGTYFVNLESEVSSTSCKIVLVK